MINVINNAIQSKERMTLKKQNQSINKMKEKVRAYIFIIIFEFGTNQIVVKE